MVMKSGCWWLTSEKDPRWNCEGTTGLCGGFVMPEECKAALEQKKRELGTPPDDLDWGYMKD